MALHTFGAEALSRLEPKTAFTRVVCKKVRKWDRAVNRGRDGFLFWAARAHWAMVSKLPSRCRPGPLWCHFFIQSYLITDDREILHI